MLLKSALQEREQEKRDERNPVRIRVMICVRHGAGR